MVLRQTLRSYSLCARRKQSPLLWFLVERMEKEKKMEEK